MNRYAIRFAKRWYEQQQEIYQENYALHKTRLLECLDNLKHETESQIKRTTAGDYELTRCLGNAWKRTTLIFHDPPKTPRPSYETILRGTIQATEHPKVTIRPKEWTLVWVTDPITLIDEEDTDHCIGQITITIQPDARLSVWPPKDTDIDERWHPHVSETHPCLGAYATSIHALLGAGYFVEALMQIEAILKNYQREDAYWTYENQHTSCMDCGDDIPADDAFYCAECDATVCEACVHYCDACTHHCCGDHNYRCCECYRELCFDHINRVSGGLYCDDCVGYCENCQEMHRSTSLECCEDCDSRICPDCRASCSRCGKLCCQGCLDEYTYCTDCHDNETDSTIQLETP